MPPAVGAAAGAAAARRRSRWARSARGSCKPSWRCRRPPPSRCSARSLPSTKRRSSHSAVTRRARARSRRRSVPRAPPPRASASCLASRASPLGWRARLRLARRRRRSRARQSTRRIVAIGAAAARGRAAREHPRRRAAAAHPVRALERAPSVVGAARDEGRRHPPRLCRVLRDDEPDGEPRGEGRGAKGKEGARGQGQGRGDGGRGGRGGRGRGAARRPARWSAAPTLRPDDAADLDAI